jgi:hypothetical protein
MENNNNFIVQNYELGNNNVERRTLLFEKYSWFYYIYIRIHESFLFLLSLLLINFEFIFSKRCKHFVYFAPFNITIGFYYIILVLFSHFNRR